MKLKYTTQEGWVTLLVSRVDCNTNMRNCCGLKSTHHSERSANGYQFNYWGRPVGHPPNRITLPIGSPSPSGQPPLRVSPSPSGFPLPFGLPPPLRVAPSPSGCPPSPSGYPSPSGCPPLRVALPFGLPSPSGCPQLRSSNLKFDLIQATAKGDVRAKQVNSDATTQKVVFHKTKK